MPGKQQAFLIAPLRGMDERWEVAPTSATSIENMFWTTQDSWRTAKGYRRVTHDYVSGEDTVNYWDSIDAPISLFWFCQQGNALQYLVYEDAAGFLKYFNGSDAPSDPKNIIKFVDNTNVGSVAYSRSCKGLSISNTVYGMFGRNLYIFNGVDLPLVFDGRKATRAGYSQRPGIPKVELAGKLETRETVRSVPFGIGYINSRNKYRYAVTFVNERGQESPFSAYSEPLEYSVKSAGTWKYVTDTSGPVTEQLDAGSYRQQPVIEIPIGPPGTVARRIYRTQNMISFIEEGSTAAGSGSTLNYTEQFRESEYGRDFYLLDELQDNIVSIYVDTQSDLDLGLLMSEDDLGLFPTNTSLMAVYKNTMFLADENTSVVRYSRPLNPEVFPKLNFFDLSDNQTSLVTGLYATRDALLIFKSNATYIVTGDPLKGFYAQTLSTDIGCIAPQSIRDVPGVGVMFMSRDGIYKVGTSATDSGSPFGFVNLSTPIQKLFRRVNISYAKYFRSVINHKDKEYWLAVSMDSDQYPNHILKFSYEIQEWSIYTDVDCSGLAEAQDTSGNLFMASHSTTSGQKGLMVYGGSNVKAGKGGFESLYETSNISLNGMYEHFGLERIKARVLSFGHSLTADVIVNRETVIVADSNSAIQTRPLEDASYPTFGGSNNFDEGWLYKEHRPIPIRMDVSTMSKGPVNELRIKFRNSDEFEIFGMELTATIGQKRGVQTLTRNMGGGYGI